MSANPGDTDSGRTKAVVRGLERGGGRRTQQRREGASCSRSSQTAEQVRVGCLPGVGLSGGHHPLSMSKLRGTEENELGFEQT